ncbi:MAG: pseudouridine synthase [Rhodobacteraceae bacterium]|nr:pseudouridine synthase [Paracoccaceae bacterium]
MTMSDETTKGDRIAKVMARAGVASRRDAEKMIVAGRVTVNGKTVTSPALDVSDTDRVTLDGKPIDAPQPARLWLYFKPLGLVTSTRDEKGRQTVFDTMPEGMPRVMSVGRLDLTSEGLLLLTNDGELKRRLELPSTGWLRKYRVRVNGRPNEATFDPLRRGVTIEGEEFQPMDITLDKQQGANAWLTVGIREGRNREVRRAMAEVGLTVNRLIRVSYGPFRLNKMKPGDVVEVKQKVLREQLGTPDAAATDADERPARKPRATGTGPKAGGTSRPARAPMRKEGGKETSRAARPSASGPADARRPRRFSARDGGEGDKGFKPRGPKPAGDRPARPQRDERATGPGERSEGRPFRSRGPKDGENRPARPPREGGERPAKAQGGEGRPARPPRASQDPADRDRSFKPRGAKPGGHKSAASDGPRKAYPDGRKPFGKPRDEEAAERKPRAGKTYGKPRDSDGADRPRRFGKPGGKPERTSSGPERRFDRAGPKDGAAGRTDRPARPRSGAGQGKPKPGRGK